MENSSVMSGESQSILRTRWVKVALRFLPFLIVGGVCLYTLYFLRCIDGCGPYHNRAITADLDSDGDLDVVVSNLRHESDTIVWAGATLWINQRGGKFTPRSGDFGGAYTTAGDVDGDGDVDLLRWANDRIEIHLNYGEEDPAYGGFQVWYGIRQEEGSQNWHFVANGSIALGDLNGDDRLDAVVGKCCASMMDKQDDTLPYLPWVWINTPDQSGYPKGEGLSLKLLGDLPMQPALGDLDGDGDLDIYAASLPPKSGNYDSSDRILLNDGSGVFADSGQRLDNSRKAGTAGSGSVALGDLDADGDLDALAATARGASIWINQGGAQGGQTGTFTRSGPRLDHGYIEAVFLADMDADGDLDAVVAGGKQAAIWWNEAQGEFLDSGQRLKYPQYHGLAVGDFDGDGDLDVFSAGANQFHLWLNQGDGRLQAHD